MVKGRVPASRHVTRKRAPMELGRRFMFEEIMPLREKQSGRVDNFEGDLTGLCHM